MRRLLIAALVTAAAFIYFRSLRPLEHPPGLRMAALPEQTDLAGDPSTISHNGWSLQPLAAFSLEARVLGVRRYSGDLTADLAPYDLALGWGPMSDTAVLEKLEITQSRRFYHWRYWGKPPIPEKEITAHSTNAHLIPANDTVARRLRGLKKGSLVRIHGLLVEATHPQANKPWRSSLTRTDTGDGACEIIYVQSLTLLSDMKKDGAAAVLPNGS